MEYVGHAEDLAGLQHGAAKQGIALGIIRVIAQGGAVERIAVKVRRIINKVKLHAVVASAIDHGTEAVMVVKGNGDAGDGRGRLR